MRVPERPTAYRPIAFPMLRGGWCRYGTTCFPGLYGCLQDRFGILLHLLLSVEDFVMELPLFHIRGCHASRSVEFVPECPRRIAGRPGRKVRGGCTHIRGSRGNPIFENEEESEVESGVPSSSLLPFQVRVVTVGTGDRNKLVAKLILGSVLSREISRHIRVVSWRDILLTSNTITQA